MLRPLASYGCPELMVCLHSFLNSFFGCKLLQAEAAWAMVSPLQQAVKDHLPPHEGPLQRLARLHTSAAHGDGSVLGTHRAHIWLCCSSAGGHRHNAGTDEVLQGSPEAFMGWR